jgi:ketosteroid isomerase-like protein
MERARLSRSWSLCALLLAVNAVHGGVAMASEENDRRAVARIDIDFQRAVKANDAVTMAEILHRDMVLILGDGRIETRDQQLQEALDKQISYEIQDEDPGTQTVRVYGDTAIVTARLHVKGEGSGRAFDRRLWFSDVYVRSADGWKYVLGQASLALPSSTVLGQRADPVRDPS